MRKKISDLLFIVLLIAMLFVLFDQSYGGFQSTKTNSDSYNILFIGNSFTGNYNIPDKVALLSAAANKNVFVDKYIMAGRSLDEISENPGTKVKIYENNWDYVILQGGCHNAAYPNSHHIIIPWAGYHPLVPALRTLRDMALDNCESTKIVYFMPWAFEDGMTWVQGQTDTYFDMQIKIHDNSIEFANELDLMIAPVGWTWYNVLQQKPGLELWSSDMSHASPKGAYLAACVFFVTFFQESLVHVPYYQDIAEDEANYFQTVASSIVLDSLELWNISTAVIETNRPIIPLNFEIYQNYPNPFNANTKIEFYMTENNFVTLQIINTLGRRVSTLLNQQLSPGEYSVNFEGSQLASGIYFYQLKVGSQLSTKSMILLK